jgi:hypothetical protein
MAIKWNNPESYTPREVETYCAQADSVDGLIGTSGMTTYSAFKASVREFLRNHGATTVLIRRRTMHDTIAFKI